MDQFGHTVRERDQAQRIKTFGSESQPTANAPATPQRASLAKCQFSVCCGDAS